MKNAILISLLFLGHSAMACLQQNDFLVCPGDKVIVKDGDGYVVGVNPIAKKVSVDFTRGSSRYSGLGTYGIDEITLAKGCAGYICVGDTVYVREGDGQVEAVNAYTQKVSVNFTRGASRYSGLGTYSISEITSIGKGCIYGYCVGDTAVVNDGDGVIKGVDPIHNKATIDFTSGRSRYSGVGTYDLSQISINAFCLDISQHDPRRRIQSEVDYTYYFSPR